jgi:6-phosphogluconolactonase
MASARLIDNLLDQVSALKCERYTLQHGTPMLYMGSADGSIKAFKFDPVTGSLKASNGCAQSVRGMAMFMCVDPTQNFLYAVEAASHTEGSDKGDGFIVVFKILHAEGGKLQRIGRQRTAGDVPCHVSLDHTGKFLLVANYSGANVASLAIGSDGLLGEPISVCQIKDEKGVCKEEGRHSRQEAPHPHQIVVDPANKFAFVCDLGFNIVQVQYAPALSRLYRALCASTVPIIYPLLLRDLGLLL